MAPSSGRHKKGSFSCDQELDLIVSLFSEGCKSHFFLDILFFFPRKLQLVDSLWHEQVDKYFPLISPMWSWFWESTIYTFRPTLSQLFLVLVSTRCLQVGQYRSRGWSSLWRLPPRGSRLQAVESVAEQLRPLAPGQGEDLPHRCREAPKPVLLPWMWRLFCVEHEWQSKCEQGSLQAHIWL